MALTKLARLMGACPAGMLVSIHPHCSLVRPDQLLDCILDSAPESQAAALATNALFTTNNGSNTRRSGVPVKSRGSPDRSRPRGLARSTARSGERSDRGAVDIPPSERKPPRHALSSKYRATNADIKKRSDFWSHVRNSFAEKCGDPVSRMTMVSEEEVLDPGACQEDAVAAGFRH